LDKIGFDFGLDMGIANIRLFRGSHPVSVLDVIQENNV